MVSNQRHFLLVTFPLQGHINPTLQYAKQLIRLGVKVTFTTTVSAYRRMNNAAQVLGGLNFVSFSDGFDDGYNDKDIVNFMSQFRIRGTEHLKETIISSAKEGSPVTCVVYALFLPWAAEVARDLNVPSALLWIQPASVFRIYYYYFNGYVKFVGDDDCNKPSWSVELPGLPLLKIHDLPSLCLPSNSYRFALDLCEEQIEVLCKEDKPKVLINSFDTLEEKALKEIDGKIKMIAVGPLIPSAFLDRKDPSDTSFGGDLFEKSKNYVEWMNTKPKGSIVYISFGSIIVLSRKQKEAMAHGLLASGKPFLWVIRDDDEGETEYEDEELSCLKELEKIGVIVPWCSQLEVLSHPSLGCFVSHCGWNSTLESIVCGVPVVTFPLWTDQPTNAKLLDDEWKTGVRVKANKDGIVEGEEIRRCIETVMGRHDRGEELRKNAKKWKELAREAMTENGSSDMNLKAFVEEVGESLNENKVLLSGKELELIK